MKTIAISISTTFFLLFLFNQTKAQEKDPATILVTTTSVTQIPADQIFFSVTLSIQNEDAQRAFEEHKTLEQNLLKIFSEMEFKDTSVSYSLLNIHRTHSREKPMYQTRQTINITFDEFNKYEQLQLKLLSNGIYSFSAKFTAKEAVESIEKGIEEAISKATKEAEMTAEKLNKELGEIVEIQSSHYYPSPSDGSVQSLTVQAPGESLIDLPRFVQLRVSLRITFELLNE